MRRAGRITILASALASAGSLLVPRSAGAWLLHEHARITATAFGSLTEAERATFREAWARAREGGPLALKLCAEPGQARPIAKDAHAHAGPWCAGYNALPALAGDHSCSPKDLRQSLETAAFIPAVLREAARLEEALASDGGAILKRIDERRVHDITLQVLDSQYLTRAKAGGAHFQLTRNNGGELRPGEGDHVILREYLARALATGQATNATALYVNYHGAALEIAAGAQPCWGSNSPGCKTAGARLWDALTTEAFALHFLQDAFSSGHFVGTWGDASQRFGTHDYYCRNGTDALTFGGDAYIANGDLFLKEVDARRAGRATAESLRQVLLVMNPALDKLRQTPTFITELKDALPDANFDACIDEHIPPGLDALATAESTQSVVRMWPRPSLRSPEVPRFRAEVGFFIGASLTADAALSASPAGATASEVRVRPAIRAGYGLEGAMSRYMDGRFFAELVGAGALSSLDGDARFGVGARVHIPFAVVPGDGLLAPGAALGFPISTWIARHAALGSIYAFERPILLGEENTLQITAGRDATLLIYPATEAHMVRRYELLLSVLNMTIGRAYSQQVTNELGLELGFQMILSKGDNVDRTFGGYLSLSTGSRVYP